MLTCQKAAFDLPADEVYLNSAFMGPLPRRVQQAGLEAVARRANPARLRAEDFFEPAERVRVRCARLVKAEPEQVALVPHVAAGMGLVAQHLKPRTGQNVVLLGEQFPSNVYPWWRWRAQGVAMRTVAAPALRARSPEALAERALGWNRRVLEAIDRDTALVALEQAHWTDGTLFDLEAVARRCREVGAAWVVDGTQTVGAMPLDAGSLKPDALVVHSYKAMLANYGLGFAVLAPGFAEAAPMEESWQTRLGAQNFARLVDYQEAYAPGMRRHDTALRANPVLIGMLEAACGLLLEWQPARIRDYLLAISRPAVARLREAGFGIAEEADRAANLFGIHLPAGMEPEATRSALAAERIHVSVRGACVRVSPHVCNDEADLMRLADALIALQAKAR